MYLADIEAELPRLRDGADLVIVAALDDHTTRRIELPAASSTIVLPHVWPRAGLSPGIDPVGFVGPYPNTEHEQITDAARQLLADYLDVDPALSFDVDLAPP